MKPSTPRTRQLMHLIFAGDVVACPAEAVWGLSCDPFSEETVLNLLAMKSRVMCKGLIVVAAEEWMFEPLLAELSPGQRMELTMSWPGPNTWLVPNRGVFPTWITGDSDEVAIRITSSPALRALSLAVGGPLVSTSANPSGSQPARHAFQVVRYFGPGLARSIGAVDLEKRPSVIRRIMTHEIIRA